MSDPNLKLYGLIMAGGVGSRFWPESRESRPKQFLDILGTGRSLLRMTFERLLPLIPAKNIRVLTHEKYAPLVLEHLPEINESQLILEPSRNNTAPCIAYASMKIQHLDPDSILVITPADHIILKEDLFREKIHLAADFASRHSALITLGIQPSRPDTGYGYIHYDRSGNDPVRPVRQFTEKPSLDRAKSFIASGDFVWNAGIFIWKTSDILNAFDKWSPDVLDKLLPGKELMNTENEREFIQSAYPSTPAISIDYAIMEKADNVFTIPADIAWSDLGTWNSVYLERDKDDQGNVIDGQALAFDSSGCLMRMPSGKLGVIKGLEDFIVVDDKNVLLIWPRNDEQAIKAVREKIDPQYL